MMAATCLLLVWAALIALPDTAIGRALHRLFVDWPARRLPLIHRGHIAFAVLLVAIGFGLTWLIEGDAIRLMSMAAPEIATWATMFEVTTLLDAGIAILTAASVVRLRPVVAAVTRLARRAPRTRRSQSCAERTPANDDDRPLRLAA